jgi:hypothetical protein
MLPKYTDDLNRDKRRSISKRSAYQIDDTYLEYPQTIFKRINVSKFINYIFKIIVTKYSLMHIIYIITW